MEPNLFTVQTLSRTTSSLHRFVEETTFEKVVVVETDEVAEQFGPAPLCWSVSLLEFNNSIQET